MRIDVLSIFPELVRASLSEGMTRIAQEQGAVELVAHDLRGYTDDFHRTVDDAPYGGGPGMVMMPGPVFDCFEHVKKISSGEPRTILLTPQGQRFTQTKATELSSESRLVLISGRYEGFDERIREGLGAEQISVGDFVLSGGELAAMAIIDAVVRLLPGALGDQDSSKIESFSNGLLEYPQYTRPPEFRGIKVPDVLLSGDHKKIAEWRSPAKNNHNR